jgi:arylsulfatase A-like enzyme
MDPRGAPVYVHDPGVERAHSPSGCMNDFTPPSHLRDAEIFRLALWSGLVMGFGEAFLFLTQQRFGRAVSVNVDIVWAALIFDTLVCLVVAAVGVAVARLTIQVRRLAAWVFAFLIFANWVAIVLNERVNVIVMPILAAGLAKFAVDLVERRPGRVRDVVRRSVVPLAVSALVASVSVPVTKALVEDRAVASLPTAPPGAPNVLIIVLDALRADHSSAYGYARPTTPNMDAVAADGTLFERAFATSSYTLASHASILTGLLPHQHNAEWVEPLRYRDCACETLGEALQARGYVTAGFSSNPYWFTAEYGFARGFHRFEDFFNTPADAAIRTVFGRAVERLVLPRIGYLDVPGRKRADFVNRRVLRWLDASEGRPFFAFVNYFDVHDPYLPPEPFRSRYAGRPVGGIINWRVTGLDPQLPDSVIADEMDAYDGALTYLDTQVGALLDSLAARGQLDNTIVVITSDHGEEFGEHGFVLHGHALHVQSLHVPLIIRGPGVTPGVRVSSPVSNAAIPSTLMGLAFGAGGFPWTPLLGGSEHFDPPISELVQKPWGSERFPAFHGAMQSVADGPWHYIRHQVFDPELYDLDTDPAETTDLVDRPEVAEARSRLDARLDDSWTGPPPPAPVRP